jgi:uncharacterized protein YbbK (DUF523 family)
MHHVLVSSCLLGDPVRYDGGHCRCAHPVLERWLREGRVVPVCPEVAAGLPTPRPPAEIAPGGTGAAVLSGAARVVDPAGLDLTGPFVRGARLALELARVRGIRVAVLKEGSPSCGSSAIHDGTFAGARIPGAGTTAALLARAGLHVFHEAQLDEADRCLKALDLTSPPGRLDY